MVREYPKRMNICYKTFSMKNRSRQFFMRCECGKKFKRYKHTDTAVCPQCGNIITDEYTVWHTEVNSCTWFNAATTMFIDDGKITISLFMLSVFRETGDHYPTLGDSFRLKVKFDLRKRMAVAFTQNINCSDEEWKMVRIDSRFLNYTQPCGNENKIGKYDIRLPKELINEFFDLLGVERPDSNVGILELAWVNRTRLPVKAAMREMQILKDLTSYVEEIQNEDYRITTNNLDLYKQCKYARNLMRKYLKTLEKPKKFDEIIFVALCNAYEVDPSDIPKNLIKYHYQNPQSLSHIKNIEMLYTNRDVKINAILSVEHPSSWGFLFNKDKASLIHEVFGDDASVLRKLGGGGDYHILYDTATMIKELRDQGEKIKTKGSLRELHDKVSRKYTLMTIPRGIHFDNTDACEDVEIGDYSIEYARQTSDLNRLGLMMDICVASYWKKCAGGHNGLSPYRIFSVKDLAGNPLACVELYNNEVIQAKAYNNARVKIAVQKVIFEYCNMTDIWISTFDIDHKLRERNYEILKKKKEAKSA